MPFTRDVGVVALVAQHGGQGHYIVIEHTAIAGLAFLRRGRGLWHIAHTVSVAVNPGEQHRSGGRAGRSNVEIGKFCPAVGQRIEVGGGNFAAEGAYVGEAPVVSD